MKDIIKIRLDSVNKQIEIYKEKTIEEIEKEEMIPATCDLLLLRDLKEQQLLLKELSKEEE